MKKLLPFIIVALLFAGCDSRTPQQKADKLVENYLNSKYANTDGFSILKSGKADTIFTTDSTKANKPRLIKGWYFYTSYITKSRFGSLANHDILIITDASCDKIVKVTELNR